MLKEYVLIVIYINFRLIDLEAFKIYISFYFLSVASLTEGSDTKYFNE